MMPNPADFCLNAYDYHLPPERIAQHPVSPPRSFSPDGGGKEYRHGSLFL